MPITYGSAIYPSQWPCRESKNRKGRTEREKEEEFRRKELKYYQKQAIDELQVTIYVVSVFIQCQILFFSVSDPITLLTVVIGRINF